MNTLIVGGTKGLGLEMARQMSEFNNVIVAGRQNPRVDFAEFRRIDLAKGNLPAKIGNFVMELPAIETFVYTPGFYQKGLITELSDRQVDEMINVCGRGLVFFAKKLLEKQGELGELVTVTSTSQRRPRPQEPVYCFAKGGAGHYSNAQALDSRVDRTLVALPSGMKGPEGRFWTGSDVDTSKFMPYDLVAKQIELLLAGDFDNLPLHEVDPDNPPIRDYRYGEAKILGADGALPQRVEIIETRR